MKKRILIHAIFWISYVLLKTYLNFISTNESLSLIDSEWIRIKESLIPQLIFLTIKIPLVYFLFYTINKFLSNKWSLIKTVSLASVAFILSILLFILINHNIVLNWFLKINIAFQTSLLFESITYSFFILLGPTGIAIAFKLVRSNIQEKLNTQEAIKIKLETELNLIKTQTNPHFLFNTLNNIYGLAIKKSDDTAIMIIKLSQLLRFMIHETKKDLINLEQEIKLLEDYIELEKIRYTNRLNLKFNSKIDENNYKITPLLLIPLVENAFKHGTKGSVDNVYIRINLEVKNNLLLFDIENSNYNKVEKIVNEQIGLKNLKRQLELCYSIFNIEIINTNNIFRVILKLNLDSYGKV